MSASNSDRNKRGNSLKRVLKYLMKLCEELGYISSYVTSYKVGKSGYSDHKQFKAAYKITFSDGNEWIAFTTTSLKDRIKEQYWDSLNIKEINPNVKQAFLVYPDSLNESDRHEFESKNKKIQNHGEYSTLDALVSQDSFFNRIEEYALKSYSPSKQREKKGNNFEKRIAATLKNPCNLKKWKMNDSMLEGLHYSLFYDIISIFGLNPSHIERIDSTSDKTKIGLLPSGGPAKTDVLTTVTYDNGTVETYTISCKRSSNSEVSVHQYSADTFADILDPNNAELRRVLNCFQTYGNRKEMNSTDVIVLEQEIHPHIMKLCEWAIAGIGGEGDPETQWANYILIYDNNNESYHINTTRDYCSLLANLPRRPHAGFNTPFTWSYQGTRGTNIQLSCRIKTTR